MDFSRATASAICSSSSRLAEMPVSAHGLVTSRLRSFPGFGVSWASRSVRRRALLGASVHQGVGDDQLGLHNPGEGQQGGLVLAFEIDGHMFAVDAGQLALEPLAALGQAIELQARLEALVGREILQPGERPVDSRTGHLQQIFAGDRGRRRPAPGDQARASRAQSSTSMVPSARSAMICSRRAPVAAHQTQAHDLEARPPPRRGRAAPAARCPRRFCRAIPTPSKADVAWTRQRKSGRPFRAAARKRHPALTDDINASIAPDRIVCQPAFAKRYASQTIIRVGATSSRATE